MQKPLLPGACGESLLSVCVCVVLQDFISAVQYKTKTPPTDKG